MIYNLQYDKYFKSNDTNYDKNVKQWGLYTNDGNSNEYNQLEVQLTLSYKANEYKPYDSEVSLLIIP